MMLPFEKSNNAQDWQNQLLIKKIIKLFNLKIIYLNIKKILIKIYVWSVATYESKICVINYTGNKTLEAFKMWYQRRMEKISWIERKTNEEVLGVIKKNVHS